VITVLCWLVSVAGLALVALLGTSSAVAPIPGGGGWPPYSLSVAPPAGVVFTIEVVALACGAVAAWRLLDWARAERGGWPARRVAIPGFLAAAGFTLLPPAGSEDLLSYLAYGSEANSGINPFTHGPQSAGVPQTPLTRAVEPPWQQTPSVYGPVFTRISTAVVRLAHGDGHAAATLMRLVMLGSFVLVALLLHRLTRSEPARRRAVALWTANPLVLSALIAGAHVDVLLAAAVVCAIALVGRSALGSGVLAALAAAVKLTGVIVLPGLLWAVRRRRRSLLAVLVGAGAVGLPLYLATSGVLHQIRHVGQYTTPAAPWRVVRSLLEPLLGVGQARAIIPLLAAVVGLALVGLLFRRGLPAATGTSRVQVAGAVTATFSIGWLLTAPYVLPWYDAMGWATLALVGASVLDRALVVHATALSYALLPGREIPLPAVVDVASTVLHNVVSPLALLAVLVVVVRTALRRPRVQLLPAVEAAVPEDTAQRIPRLEH
jgi:hypothetical protein